jgi:hypothetical protein
MADTLFVHQLHEAINMAAIILGKILLTDEELIEHAFSDMNVTNLNLVQLKGYANDAAIHSSLMLIRMMKAERIYVELPHIQKNRSNHSAGASE